MAREYKKYKDYTKEERDRYIRLGERPFTTSKKSTTNIRPKDEKKGTTGTTVNTGAKKETRASARNYKRPRYGGDKDLPPKGSRIQFPPNPANIKKKDEKKKDKDIAIGGPAITGAALLAGTKIAGKSVNPLRGVLAAAATRVKPKSKTYGKTKPVVKPKPTVVKPKPKPTLGTKPPAQTRVTRLTRAGLMGADTGPSQADKARAKAETKKPKIGTKTPAQDKVKKLQAAQRKGADTGPSDADKAKAKAEKQKIKQQKTYGKKPVTTAKPKPKVVKTPGSQKNIASKTQQNTIKKIVEQGQKAGKSKSAITAAIKKAIPGVGKLAIKVGGRLIPGLGWGLLAYDAYRIGKALKGDKITGGKDDVFGDGVGFKYGGKIPKTMRKGGKVSHYKHGQSIKRGLIKDVSNGNDFISSIYDN